MAKRRRRRRKKNHRVYAFVTLILAIAIIVIGFGLLFYVQKIEVSGNDYTEEKTITETMQKDTLSFNSVYLLVKYRFLKHDTPKSLDSMKVSLKNPWTVKVTVKEKAIIGYLDENGEYAYFDKEGKIVLKSTELQEGVPGIEGIDASSTKLYQKIKVKSDKLLQAILDVAVEVKNYNLTPDRIVYEDDGINLYFGDICVQLGTDVTTEKMAQISPIIAKLAGKSGVLHLEHYEDDSNVITFSEESAEDTSEDTSSEDGSSEDLSGGSTDNAYNNTYDGTSNSTSGSTGTSDYGYSNSYGTSDSQDTYYGE